MVKISRGSTGVFTEIGLDRKSVEKFGKEVSDDLNDFLIEDLGFSKSKIKGFK